MKSEHERVSDIYIMTICSNIAATVLSNRSLGSTEMAPKNLFQNHGQELWAQGKCTLRLCCLPPFLSMPSTNLMSMAPTVVVATHDNRSHLLVSTPKILFWCSNGTILAKAPQCSRMSQPLRVRAARCIWYITPTTAQNQIEFPSLVPKTCIHQGEGKMLAKKLAQGCHVRNVRDS